MKEDKSDRKEPPGEEGKKVDNNQQLLDEIAQGKAKEIKRSFAGYFLDKLRKKDLSFVKSGVKGIVDEYKSYKSTKDEVLVKYSAYETVVAGATDSMEYYILLILSCLIATIGLYQNSPAVIIGAMIVAPLMGPIFGFSAAVLWGSGKGVIEAVTTLIKGVILVLIVTAGLSFVIPGIVVTEEMLGRSFPSLFDIIVTLACGLIGAFSFVNRRISSAIPGVAISVALMPPLCTIGIGLGLLNWELARGAALLFGVNLIGISFSAVIVFYLVKLHPQAQDKTEFSRARKRAAGQILVSIIILIFLSVPLILFTSSSIKRNLEGQEIRTLLKNVFTGSRIYSLDVDDSSNSYRIEVILIPRTGRSSYPKQEIEKQLEKRLGHPVELVLFTMPRLEEELPLAIPEPETPSE